MLLKVCLNGPRGKDEHPAVPVTPSELAKESRRSVAAGAEAVHLHPRDESGAETLAAAEVGVSTGAWIEADPGRRSALVRGWGELEPSERPDFASVNLFESGWREVCEALVEAGIGVEAGLWSSDDARRLVESGFLERCLRLLLEPVREISAEAALAAARDMNRILDTAETGIPGPLRLLHGKDTTAWPVLRYATSEGLGTRIGFEDTLTLPDGEPANDNVQLVVVARGSRGSSSGEQAPR